MAKEKPIKDYDPKNPNAHLDLSRFDYKKWTPELWAEYQEIMKTLEKRRHYDFEEYNAVGIFKKVFDPMKDDYVETSILEGVALVKDAPLKTTRVEIQHIEDWRFNPRKNRLELMAGLNAQIYDKANPRTNSRFYLLKQVKVEELANA